MGQLIDISRPIQPEVLLHPGDPRPMLSRYKDMARGDDYNLTQLSMGIHTASHFDFPQHMDPHGASCEDIPLERFIVTAHVVDCGTAPAVTREQLEYVKVEAGDAVLLKTLNGESSQDRMRKPWVHITPEAAQWCVDRRAGIVGADYIEVESGLNEGKYPVHHTLLGAGILLLENIDLRKVAAGTYRLYCFPLLIPGCEGSPCRAVLEVM